jgi:Kef-type K+ transport system membrane component KefB
VASDLDSFVVIVAVAALAPLIAMACGRLAPLPAVVIELVLGILVGPQVLGWAELTDFVQFFGQLGLAFLFFFAGYEIDFRRIRGDPLRLGLLGWGMSLALAYSLAGILQAAGVIVSGLLVGSAMATTAIGTLMPILRDAGETRTGFGRFLLGAGAVGEFGPILLITLLLSGDSDRVFSAVLLAVFTIVALVTAALALHAPSGVWSALGRSMDSSSQLPIRIAVLLLVALVALAEEFGLDLVLGGFAAGIIVNLAFRGRESVSFERKMDAIGYGFAIPAFFITSGMAFDVDALFGSVEGALKLPLFFALFLIVRGTPALLLYRGVLDGRDRAALAFFSATQLPLVVAITVIGTETGRMVDSTAAALVGAAVLSTLCFPLAGLRLRGGRAEAERALGEGGEGGERAAPAPA